MNVVGVPDGSGRIAVVGRAGDADWARMMDPVSAVWEASDFFRWSHGASAQNLVNLYDMVFSPSFVVDRTFYYAFNGRGAVNRSEWSVRRSTLPVTSIETVLMADGAGDVGFVAFDKAGRLLVTRYDETSPIQPSLAQNTSRFAGKILRLDVSADDFPGDSSRNYAIPDDNPFKTSGGAPEVIAFGLKAAKRGNIYRVTGDLFLGDQPNEIDRLPFGTTTALNFGWNVLLGTQPNTGPASPGFTMPVAETTPGSTPTSGTAILGGVVYRGPIEELQGQYIFGDEIGDNFWTVPVSSLTAGSTVPGTAFTVRNGDFTPNQGQLADIIAISQDDAGNVYFVARTGGIYRLEPLP